MNTSESLGLVAFSFAASITPGPNNLMLLASGVNFGFRRTIPHMLGIGIGFMLMLVVVGLGVGRALQASTFWYACLRIASLLYMLWLAWKIATSGPVGNDPMQPAKSRPLTFVQAVLFQWVNPKALVMAVAATAAYTQPDDYFASLMIVAIVFGAINAPCVSVWTLFGLAIRRVLRDARKVRVFNFAMAALLMLSFLPLVADLVELV